MADDEGAGQEQFVSLYRRFRPGRFGELRGQPHVVRALQGAVRDDRVAHAYLFSGPRGTGKTSTARILARALNCTDLQDGEPCGTCASCIEIARGNSLDVHELDAASNNGVDAMRDLISHAALATPGRWKVYIVDEVHMLSNAAANALLKTLEEPPGHVVFVLATTDPQKVPPTIRSRTQHFEFGLLPADTLTELLRDVRDAAGLPIEDDAVSVAVRKGRGSARDALSALDQVAASGDAEALRPEVAEVTEAIADEDAQRALVAVAGLAEAGWGAQQLASELIDELRQAFLAVVAPDLCAAAGVDREQLAARAGRTGLPRLVRSIEALGRAQVDMREAPDPRAVLEVALVRLTRPDLDESAAGLMDRVTRLEQALAALTAGGGGHGPTGQGLAGQGLAGQGPVGATPGAPSAPTGERPGFGAIRRQRAASPAQGGEPVPVPGETARPAAAPRAIVPPTAAAPTGAPSVAPTAAAPFPESPSQGSPSQESPSPESPESTTAAPAVPGNAVASAAPDDPAAPSAAAPDRDALVQAWGDHILRGLPARAKALYSAGRFVGVEGTTVTFALPNDAHRDRCEEVRPLVEDVLVGYFSSPLSLRLIVDDGRQPAPLPGMGITPPQGRGPVVPGSGRDDDAYLDPDDDFDPDGPGQSGSVESLVQARVLEAFPGAEEVSG